MNEILAIRTALAENNPDKAVNAIRTEMGFDYFMGHYKTIDACFKKHWVHYSMDGKFCKNMSKGQLLVFLKGMSAEYIQRKKECLIQYYDYDMMEKKPLSSAPSLEGKEELTLQGLCIGFDFQVYISLTLGDQVLFLDSAIAAECLQKAKNATSLSIYVLAMDLFMVRGSQRAMPVNLLVVCGNDCFQQKPFYIPLLSRKEYLDMHTAKDI